MIERDHDEVRRWARTLAHQLCADVPPLLGSPEWVAASGPARLAGALIAALCWLEEIDPHRLAVEVEAELEAFRRCEEGDFQSWKQIARRVRALADEPTFAELQRRRSA